MCHSAEAWDRDKGHLGLDELETGGLVRGLQRGKGPPLGSAGWSEPGKEGEASREGTVHRVTRRRERKMGENGGSHCHVDGGPSGSETAEGLREQWTAGGEGRCTHGENLRIRDGTRREER